MMEKFHIGCSGYYYPAWKNAFYPPRTAPKNWLAYYATVFDTVELNGTFYRKPQLAHLERYAAVTPPGFTFSAKMSRYVTHILRMESVEAAVAEFQDLVLQGLGEKLKTFLFQFPATFTFSDENLERILRGTPHHERNVIEFRHASWWNPKVIAALAEAGITMCSMDFPGLQVPFTATSGIFYLRLHGNPELFKSSYSDEALEKFVAHFPAECREYRIYFNNTYYDAAYRNAAALIKMINLKINNGNT